MRVTNERAQSAIKAHHITGNLTNIVKDYAADLLEAREHIKEMRGIIRRYVKLDTRCEVQDNLNSNATSILKKTKEYAE